MQGQALTLTSASLVGFELVLVPVFVVGVGIVLVALEALVAVVVVGQMGLGPMTVLLVHEGCHQR